MSDHVARAKKRLTKSRFKIGSECPTKLYFNDRKEYANNNSEDQFLKALADGGFQVGELSKLYYPGGEEVKTLDYEAALEATNALLERDNVIIYEAALGFENLFVRVDILVKRGSEIELIEVKAKSFDPTEEFEPFDKRLLKSGKYSLKADMKPYLLDVAFQTYVARKAKPQFRFTPYLMMADKSTTASVEGLNQLFLIQNDNGRSKVIVRDPKADLGVKILGRLELSDTVDKIVHKCTFDHGGTFEGLVRHLSSVMKSESRLMTPVGSQCKSCEFRIDAKKSDAGKKSGFSECWSEEKKLSTQDLAKQFVFDVWDYRSSDKAIEQDKLFASQLAEDDLKMKSREDGKSGLSRTERQLLQVEAARVNQPTLHIERELLADELKSFQYPLHFIDFETTMVAIPFHAGRRPYEQMAFQFSHHILHEDGRLEHKTEYLDDRRGVFPNFDFVRALKKALSNDSGTVFRFAAHENTVLNQIRGQLLESDEADAAELINWIQSLTSPPKEDAGAWTPSRQFIDMRDLTLRFYFLPETGGSNSIKKILPAVLNQARASVLVQFSEWIVRDESGRVKDPYKLLPPIFADVDSQELEKVEQFLIARDDLNDGGAAMMAWSRMQFTEMSEVERKGLRAALLRYCALDTLAMVMIFKWWVDVSQPSKLESATG
jgi:hypothetical protein